MKLSALLKVILPGLITPLFAQPSLDLETGFVSAGYNDVRIPGDQGTLFSLSDDPEAAASFYFCLLSYHLSFNIPIILLILPFY